MDTHGGTASEVSARIRIASAAFIVLNKIWTSIEISIPTKLRMVNRNVKVVQRYGSDARLTLKLMLHEIQTVM